MGFGTTDKVATAEEVDKLLGAPVFMEFTENVRKMRAQLLVFSTIAIAVVWMGVKIKPDTPVFGITFEGLTENKILLGLLIVITYQFVHFVWTAFDSFLEWRVRTTGARIAFQEPGMPRVRELDYAADPKQSTLYNWWRGHAKYMENMSENVTELRKTFEKVLDAFDAGPPEGVIEKQLAEIKHFDRASLLQNIGLIQGSIDTDRKVLLSSRIEASLARFDHTYKVFFKSQNLRWILLELAGPVLLGVFAMASIGRALLELA
ncbi:MAG: hypothetical protein V4713_12215 [Pseudomonadota bacterium]